MSWGLVAAAGATVIGGYLGNKGAEKGANAQVQAANAATAEDARQFDQTQRNLQPFLDQSYNALNLQNRLLSGDTSGFMTSPDYTFARDQALQAQERGAAARGGFMGGGADADRIALAEGLATQNLGNYWNRLAGVAGQGQTTATNLGQFGANYAGNVGQNLQNAGAARASSYASQANTWGNVAGQLGGLFGQYMGGRNPSSGSSAGQMGNFGNNIGAFRYG